MLNTNRFVTIGLAFALAASPLALTACGGSSSSDSASAAAESTDSDSAASSDSTAADSSAGQSYSISMSEITEAYMGASEAGETVYYVGNDDGSKTGIFFLDADNQTNVSFLGPATVTQQDGENLVTITGYSGYDPEVGASTTSMNVFGLDNGRYPSPTSYTFSLNIGF